MSVFLRRFRLCLGHSRLVGHLPAAIVIALLLTVTAQAQVFQGGTVKAQHGDWQVFCKAPPPGAKNEICGVVQSVTSEDNDNIGLTVIAQRFSDGKLVLRVVVSLGVFLGKGLGVQVDDQVQGHVPFDRCLLAGCQAQMLVDDALLARLKAGKTMMFIVYRTQEAGIGIPTSLSGFGQALNGLR